MTVLAHDALPVEIETRAAKVVDVSFPKRLIQVVVMPYESPTVVEHKGRLVEEIVSRGAFGSIERRHGVQVNRGHVIERVVGKVTRFYPDRQDGLIADLRMSNVADASETLELANDGLLGASAGFQLKTSDTGTVEQDAESWENNRQRRRLNRIWLHHVAMVAQPAYSDAQVLAVRAADEAVPPPADPSTTPLLDQARVWRFQDKYGTLA